MKEKLLAGNGYRRRLIGGGGRKCFIHTLAIVLPVLMVLAAIGVPKAMAAVADWRPVLARYHSQLTLQGVYATDSTKTDTGSDSTQTRQALRETVGLNTVSYLYHPDLLLVGLSGNTGRDQSRLVQNGSGEPIRGGFEGYNLEGILLRKKPYTVNFFSNQDHPFNTSLEDSASEVTRESGAEFNYNERTYRLRSKYVHNSQERQGILGTTDSYDLFGYYSKPQLGRLEDFMTTAMGRYQTNLDITGRRGAKQSTNMYGDVTNRFQYHRIFDFNTSLHTNSSTFAEDRDNDHSDGDTDSYSMSELVDIELPWNFTSELEGSVTKQANNSSTTNRSQSSDGDGSQVRFNLAHQLFRSLSTQMSMSSSSRDSSRINGIVDDSGSIVEAAPVQGTNEQDQFQLRARYKKQLPLDSTLTSDLSTRSTNTIRTGITAESSLFQAVAENGGPGSVMILPGTADVAGTIEVDILQVNLNDHPGDICKDAVANPNTDFFSSCWHRLQDPNDYRIVSSSSFASAPSIVLEIVSDNVGFNYDDFKNPDGSHGPFTVRVRYFTKALDARTTTNTGGVGIFLFNLVSGLYQHSTTNQEGFYADSLLSPTVTEDLATVGASWKPLTLGASRQWIEADVQDVKTKFWATYSDSKTWLQRVTSTLQIEGVTVFAESESDQGDSLSSSENSYAIDLDSAMPLPKIGASMTLQNRYSYTSGTINSLALNSDGIYVPEQDFGIDGETIFSNSFGLIKNFTIPRVKIELHSYARYHWETSSNAGIDRDRSLLQYGARANRRWKLGATSVNLAANYANTNEVLNSGGSIFRSGNQLHRDEENSAASVVLTIVRQLF